MTSRGEVTAIPHLHDLFEVTVPYARAGLLDEREILFEANPYATLSHFSALTFHGLTDAQPRKLMATVPRTQTGELLPIGTNPQDWEGVVRPAGRRPDSILGTPVHWQQVKPERFFGFAEYRPFGYPLRVTTPERTLIDALQAPDLCGGTDNVLRAWLMAGATIDLDSLISLSERFGVAVLRQRVGFILERLELSHPRLEVWQAAAKRGGSSRLVGSEPFAATFDERWNLSLNAPIDVLHDGAA